MSIFTLNGKRINIYASFTAPDGTHGIDMTRPENREKYGVAEAAEPQPPADYSDKLYYRMEQDDAPYVVYVRKSDEQIAALYAAEVESKKEQVRKLREVVLNRLTGIKDAARDNNDTATVEACKAVRVALLGITAGWPTDPGVIDNLVLNRWKDIVQQAAASSLTVLTAFNQVDM